MQRVIGVDVGQRRVGVAQSDRTGTLASVVGTFDYESALAKIASLCEEGDVRLIVVGWPLTLKGEEGESVEMVRKFLQTLRKKIKKSGVPIETLDERFTSSLARQSIRDSGARKKKRREKERVDATAAAILLQSFLDGAVTR